jgi:hypothetical protein
MRDVNLRDALCRWSTFYVTLCVQHGTFNVSGRDGWIICFGAKARASPSEVRAQGLSSDEAFAYFGALLATAWRATPFFFEQDRCVQAAFCRLECAASVARAARIYAECN